jgi:hypothetical protein
LAVQAHWPEEHPIWFIAQEFAPQAPQLFGSDCRSTHTPLHEVNPALHVHFPPEQVELLGHDTPQAPQLLLSVWKSCGTQVVPLQHPFGHDAALQTHAPWPLHSWFVPQAAQTPPFAPQCCVLEVMHWPFEQQPAQLVPPQLHAPDWQS